MNRTTKSNIVTCQELQLKRYMFQHMGQVAAASQLLKEATALANTSTVIDECRQPRLELLIESVHLVGGRISQLGQINPSFEDGNVRPDVWSAQCEDFAEC